MDSFERQYVVKEAAAILTCSTSHVLRLIGRKELEAWKYPQRKPFGRKRQYESWRIPESALQKFMKRNRNVAA